MCWRAITLLAALAALGLPAWPAGADASDPAQLATTDVRALAESTHRARSVVLELRHGPLTVAELNRRIPPGEPDWMEGIVADVSSAGWIEPTGAPDTYRLTELGWSALAALP